MEHMIATIQVLVATDSENDACDALAEMMRSNLRKFAPESSIIDWRYTCDGDPAEEWKPHNGDGFEYA